MSLKMVYLSYHPKDELEAKKLECFLVSLGIYEQEIAKGQDVYTWLPSQQDVYVIYVVTQNYFQDAKCLNEMGALWLHHKSAAVVLLADTKAEQCCVDKSALWVHSTNEADMKNLKDDLAKAFGLREMNDETWHSKYETYHEQKIDDKPKATVQVKKIYRLSQYAQVMLVYGSHSENCEIMMQESVSKTAITSGDVQFNKDSSSREVTKWSGALMELLMNGLIRKTESNRYVLSEAGQAYAKAVEKATHMDTANSPRKYIKESIFGI